MTRIWRVRWRAAERAAGLLAAALSVAVAGCGLRQVGDGLPPEGHARFPVIATVALFSDKARVGAAVFDATSWEIGDKATRIVGETLSAAGGQAVAVSVPLEGAASGWESRTIAALRASGRIPAEVPVLLLRELKIDEAGLLHPADIQMSRPTGYAVTALLDVAAGLSLASGSGAWIYAPSDPGDPFGALRLHGAMEPVLTLRLAEGRAVCSGGLDMRLLGADGTLLSSADAVLGQEVLPRRPNGGVWAELDAADRAMVESWCVASLRRGVLLAVRAAGVVQ